MGRKVDASFARDLGFGTLTSSLASAGMVSKNTQRLIDKFWKARPMYRVVSQESGTGSPRSHLPAWYDSKTRRPFAYKAG